MWLRPHFAGPDNGAVIPAEMGPRRTADGRHLGHLFLDGHTNNKYYNMNSIIVSVVVPFLQRAGERRRAAPPARRPCCRRRGTRTRSSSSTTAAATRRRRLIDELAERDPNLAVVHLSRNFGHQAAVSAGIDHARGPGGDRDGRRPAGPARGASRSSSRRWRGATTSSTRCARSARRARSSGWATSRSTGC